jgi:hypothetical protein
MSTTILEPVEMTSRELAHQKYLMMRHHAVSVPTRFGPVDLPELPDDAERLFFNRTELHDFVRSGDYERRLDGHSIVTRLDRETGKYAVDIVPLVVEEKL